MLEAFPPRPEDPHHLPYSRRRATRPDDAITLPNFDLYACAHDGPFRDTATAYGSGRFRDPMHPSHSLKANSRCCDAYPQIAFTGAAMCRFVDNSAAPSSYDFSLPGAYHGLSMDQYRDLGMRAYPERLAARDARGNAVAAARGHDDEVSAFRRSSIADRSGRDDMKRR
jgi:hypothetical protein